ncbi:hypothetical protein PHYBOEH_003422 [Phytophthora boehmeriae]|uniref:Uncharacterized protein n=1 Tax=Phytophthora boehmeriae TaxID=109152 RepID=A0A8T1WNM3_9STRA|nr:hypothetical protein PHYBOEH_003422 [Phytophthora boehmeriae]
MEACQVDGGAGRRSTYEASTTASEGSPDSTLPASETRPTSRTELHLSSDITSSLGSSTGGKMMDAANVEDSLNDFDDFPELDFDDPLQSTNFVKENNPSNGAKKRGIEEV